MVYEQSSVILTLRLYGTGNLCVKSRPTLTTLAHVPRDGDAVLPAFFDADYANHKYLRKLVSGIIVRAAHAALHNSCFK